MVGTRMCHFKKKNLKIFYPEWPRKNVSPCPAVALNVPGSLSLGGMAELQ